LPTKFDEAKEKIFRETLQTIESSFKATKLYVETGASRENIQENIDKASKAISNAMISGIHQLAGLVDVDFNKLLAFVFKPSESDLNGKILLVSKEAGIVYSRGEAAFNFFQQCLDKMQ
jgi:hypothetical protein